MTAEAASGRRVSVLILAYGDEPWLTECVTSVLASVGVTVDVVLVDNGCTNGSVSAVAAWGHPRVHVVDAGGNLGFAAGCNLAADRATGDVLALVNSDAVVAPGALARLAEALDDPGVGVATASVRLAGQPDMINSAGNPLHYLGFVWAGGLGEPATRYTEARDVCCASGAGMAIGRGLWESLQGFAPEYFAYHEDAELSMRVWQRGLAVRYVPDAVVLHHYEFSRNARKSYLVERNRWIFLLTLYEARTLALITPPLVAVELGTFLVALRDGWVREKAEGWAWLWRHRRWLRERRRRLQRERRVSDAELAGNWAARLEPVAGLSPTSVAAANAVLEPWWAGARRRLARGLPRIDVMAGGLATGASWCSGRSPRATGRR